MMHFSIEMKSLYKEAIVVVLQNIRRHHSHCRPAFLMFFVVTAICGARLDVKVALPDQQKQH